MGRLSKFSPFARAIGVMGVTAGLVTGVTLAAFTSNTVALDPNTLNSATAALQIANNAEGFTSTSVAGMTATLTPGVPSAPFTFYLKNNGGVALDISAHIPTVFGTPSITEIDAANVSLSLDCGSGAVTYTLAEWSAGTAAIPGNPLTTGSTWTCTEVATLSNSETGSGGKTVPTFKVEFVGTQDTPS